jgi:hypothetical protein
MKAEIRRLRTSKKERNLAKEEKKKDLGEEQKQENTRRGLLFSER